MPSPCATQLLRSIPEDSASASPSSSPSPDGASPEPPAAAAVPADFKPLLIEKKDLAEYLGPPPMPTDKLYERTPVGVVTGLAWTPLGGSTLYIECTVRVALPERAREATGRRRLRGFWRWPGSRREGWGLTDPLAFSLGQVAETGSGKGGMVKTGQLGDVMRESADIAHTCADNRPCVAPSE